MLQKALWPCQGVCKKNIVTITKSGLEQRFALQLKAIKAPQWVEQHKFHPTRRWRLDFAWPELSAAIEVEGVVWFGNKKSRHQTAQGYADDCEKYNEAALLGWRVLRVTQHHIQNGKAADWAANLLGLVQSD